ncbi:MAG: GFA family protein [Rhodospirillales bacterium]
MTARDDETAERHGGGCLCGAVRYEVRGALRPALVCHCGMCQRLYAGPAYFTAAERADLHLLEGGTLAWYRSSAQATRGFCRDCGASLFWLPEGAGYTAVSCGSLDRPSGVRAAAHIFLADQGDYYEIHDGLPQFQTGSGGQVPGAPSVVPDRDETAEGQG